MTRDNPRVSLYRYPPEAVAAIVAAAVAVVVAVVVAGLLDYPVISNAVAGAKFEA